MAISNLQAARAMMIAAARLALLSFVATAMATIATYSRAETTAENEDRSAASAAQRLQPAKLPAPTDEQAAKTVRLEFQEQSWLPVLEWLAETKNLNLDWQELPTGTLNLVSTKEYSVEEAEDLINMQLLARGFTLLERGAVLRVAPLKNLDITLVPKVDAEELLKLPRHKFVRVSFTLDWMIAEEAAVEFKPLISPYGQLYPMASSNRLEAMDAVVNLREVHRLLTRAEADEGRRERVAEFRLEHRKAEEVAVKVRQLLGLPPEPTPVDATQTQLDIEKAKFRSEAVKQLGAQAQQFLVDKPDVHLVVNEKENSILVNGRPDKIEIARQAIAAMDKSLPPGESSWESINRVKVHEVDGFDPQSVIQLMQALQERGNISKETRIQHEAAYNRLVVIASPEDHVTIASLIESFRTQGRRAEVLPLTRIDPQYATKAVELVLKNPDRPSTAPGAPSNGQFQIEPDVTNNRLLLWATPSELAEVRDFLGRLGENFASGRATQMHVVQLRGLKATDVAQRLQRVWKGISDAPLVIQTDYEEAAKPETPATSPTNPAAPSAATDSQDRSENEHSVVAPPTRLVSQQQPADGPPAASEPAPLPDISSESAQESAPVRVIADDDGDVVIVSRDPVAAETARQFIEQIVPTADDVQVVPLKHAQAIQVKMQLDALLQHTRASETSALTAKQPLSIEADSRTNRLLIQHASARQLQLIQEAAQVLDQPEQEDERLVREQRIYRAQRKPATEIAEVVKEVYRDLLSTSDKIFAGREGNQPFGYNRALAATTKSPEYQGLLSVGVDVEGNSLVISAPAYLLEEVMNLVKLVDTNGGGRSIVVVPLKSRATRANLQEAISRVFARPE